MAQVSTTTSDVQNFDLASARATIAGVRNRLLSSKTIRAQDIRDIINVYNAWTQHTHSVYDNYYVAFGNTYAYATQGANDATSLPILPEALGDGLVAGWSSPGVYYYDVPYNMTATLQMAGGGGGGGGSSTHPNQDSGPGAGGGSARYDKRTGVVLTAGTRLKITVGAGGVGGALGTWAPGGNGGNGEMSRIDVVSTGVNLGYSEGGYGGVGCYGWGGSGIWGSSGQAAAPAGSYYYAGVPGGAGNNDWGTSYQGGNGGGVGGAGVRNVSGGPGVNGYVGATQGVSRWQGNKWYQNQGAGGGGMAGNGSGMNGGLGGGGGGGGLMIAGGAGGSGYVGIYVPFTGGQPTTLATIAAGNAIILDDIRNLMALINAIKSHLHRMDDGYL